MAILRVESVVGLAKILVIVLIGSFIAVWHWHQRIKTIHAAIALNRSASTTLDSDSSSTLSAMIIVRHGDYSAIRRVPRQCVSEVGLV